MGQCCSSGDDADGTSYFVNTPLWAALGDKEMGLLKSLFVEAEYEQGEQLCVQQKEAENVYILTDGKVSFTRTQAGFKTVVTKMPGDVFGLRALGLSDDTSTYFGTAETLTKCTVFRASSDQFVAHWKTYPDHKTKCKAFTYPDFVYTAFQKTNLMSEIKKSDDNMCLLANLVMFRSLAPAEILYHQGTLGSDVHFVVDGVMEALTKTLQNDIKRHNSITMAGVTRTLHTDELHGGVTEDTNDRKHRPGVFRKLSNANLDEDTPSCGQNIAQTSLDLSGLELQAPKLPDDDAAEGGGKFRFSDVTSTNSGFSSEGRSTQHAGRVVLESMEESTAQYVAGDCFGEVGLVANMPRTCTLVAAEKSFLLELSKENLETFTDIDPSFLEQVSALAEKRTALHFRKFKIPFFMGIPDDQIHLLAQYAEVRQWEPGINITEEGKPDNRFYIIAFGNVGVYVKLTPSMSRNKSLVGRLKEKANRQSGTKDPTYLPEALAMMDAKTNVPGARKPSKPEEKSNVTKEIQIAQMSAGHYFGEVALIQESARSTTVRTTTRSVIISFSANQLNDFFQQVPEGKRAYDKHLEQYRVSMDDVLNDPSGIFNFRKFLKKQFAEEGLEFYVKVSEYKRLIENDPSNAEGKMKKANTLIDDYVRAASKYQLNLSGADRKKIVAVYDEPKSMNKDTFNKAIVVVKKLLQQNYFRRFKNSKYFRAFLASESQMRDSNDRLGNKRTVLAS